MQLKPCVKFWSKQGLRQIVFVAFIYAIFLLFGRWLKDTLYIASVMRLFNFVPVVGGFVFGLPGAIGAGLGNFIYDLIIGNLIYAHNHSGYFGITCAAAIGNFMLAYLPYRLWYALQGNKAARFIHDRHSFGMFILIVTLIGFNFAVFLTSGLDLFSPYDNKEFVDFIILFVNNYAYPILIGIPVLYWLQKRKQTFYYPPANPDKSKSKYIRAFIFLTLASVLMVIAFYLDVETDAEQAFYGGVSLFLFLYVAAIPSAYIPQAEEDTNYVSLGAVVATKLLNMTTAVMLLAIIMNMVIITNSDNNMPNSEVSVVLWLEFYVRLLLALNCVFVGVYYILSKFEKTVTEPLAHLSKQAANYKPNAEVSQDLMEPEQPNLENEIDVLETSFSKMSLDVQRYFRDLTAAKEQEHAMQAQLDVAMQIQQGALPNMVNVNLWLEEHGFCWRVAGGMEAARNVGGDMFDCFAIGEKYLFLSIGDVSGKGVTAALFAMMAQTLLSDDVHDFFGTVQVDLSDIVAHTNDALAKNNQEMLFYTLWAGILNFDTGELHYINAGHNPPLIYDIDTGKSTWVEKLSGPVLGLIPGQRYIKHSLVLPEHGRILLYTDGFNEAENPQHEFFGNERLKDAFAKCHNVEELLDDVKSFVNGAPPSDDKTYLWLERGACK